MECDNCGNEIDFDFIVEETIYEMNENVKDKEKLKKYLDEEYDFSLDMACDVCYHTKWVTGEDKLAFYEALENIKE